MLNTLPLSGLPIQLDRITGKLHLDASVTSDDPQTRMLFDSLPFYEQKEAVSSNMSLYYMYRNVRLTKDASSIDESLFRYDITVVLPGQIEKEPIKTIGHVHPLSTVSKNPYTFTEVYSVIYGTAHYILQKFSPDFSTIEEIVDLEVKAGEHVYIPSFYGHVTINTTAEPLVMANILYRDFLSNYEPYQKNRGAALYLKRNDKDLIVREKNTHYQNLPEPIQAFSKDFLAPELIQNQPLYSQWINHLNGFKFLYQDF